MGHGDFSRQRGRHGEERWGQHRSGWAGQWSGGPWGGWGGPFDGRRNRPGPPPWVAELFGLAQGQQQRGPKVRRGDVRAAILDMLREEPMNGYQLISQIAERSGGAWKPSPGSVYPTIQQLEDEGLVEADDERGRRTLRLTDEGRAYVAEHADELAETWAPFGQQFGETRGEMRGEVPPGGEYAALKPEIGQVMAAVWQIVTTGTDRQRREAINMLVETRRKLYGILAEDDESHQGSDDVDDDGTDEGDSDDYPGADGGER
jgi:DNA-binding PadR family transcriptional regulator